ncbi:MAG: diphosphokinase / guanosine-3,5-bis(diphosphate) 3-diphosphatase, partial [Thermoleophilaceae bacterium]|nr:diphosphokinase / guanosine-3,5-bis(diphosphate) 3-diphosphatase [Thermoleophilaceae bacterium]
MPKLPRGTGKATTKERAKKPAAKPAAATTRSTAKKSNGTTPKKKPAATRSNGRRTAAPKQDFRHRPVDRAETHAPAGPKTKLTDDQRVLLGDLFAVVEEHAGEAAEEIDRGPVEKAFVFSCERHADQRRASGEDFIMHPIGVAKICAGMRLDTATLCAALLHDTVEDTSASLDEVREEFGDEVAQLVDGVTKLSGVTFQSRDDRQAENYRKMMVAMARDIRVILIKLADRLHNMRTIGSMPKAKQHDKARETLEIFAPLAHRLGIHAIKWEL